MSLGLSADDLTFDSPPSSQETPPPSPARAASSPPPSPAPAASYPPPSASVAASPPSPATVSPSAGEPSTSGSGEGGGGRGDQPARQRGRGPTTWSRQGRQGPRAPGVRQLVCTHCYKPIPFYNLARHIKVVRGANF